jgi:hypothetical protein
VPGDKLCMQVRRQLMRFPGPALRIISTAPACTARRSANIYAPYGRSRLSGCGHAQSVRCTSHAMRRAVKLSAR